MASSPRWAAAEEKRSVCLDTLGSDQRELVVAVGESKKVGRNYQSFGCLVTSISQWLDLIYPAVTLPVLQMRSLRCEEVKGLVQGPRARLWELDLNPSLVDFGA